MYYLYDEFSGKGRGRSSFERCESQETLMAKKYIFMTKILEKKVFLNFSKFNRKAFVPDLCQASACNFFKNETLAQVFSYIFRRLLLS